MVLLPPLVFGTELKGPRMLQIGRKDDGFIPSLTGKLHTQVPSLQSDEDEVEVLRSQVFGGEGIKAVDSVSEGAGIPNMLPGEGGQARWRKKLVSNERSVY